MIRTLFARGAFAAAALSAVASTDAAIIVGPGGITYSENFDSLPTSLAAPVPWEDDSTLPGWYAAYTTTVAKAFTTSAGGNGTGQLYSFGSVNSVNGASDRALGSVATSATGSIRHGIVFLNNTGETITEFTVAYDGEQWRVATPTATPTNPTNEKLSTATPWSLPVLSESKKRTQSSSPWFHVSGTVAVNPATRFASALPSSSCAPATHGPSLGVLNVAVVFVKPVASRLPAPAAKSW